MKHATIIPLIGGEALASTEVFGSKPEYILSYEAFKDNEQHLLNYWENKVPYYVLDKGQSPDLNQKIDVVSSVCPCAGLSTMHHAHGETNENNQWMELSAEYILSNVKPNVFWGENAASLSGKIGEFMLNKLRQIGLDNGYSMSLYLTKNIKHGVPQFRKRTFYFFWKKDMFGEKTPVLHFYNKPHKKIEDIINGVTSNTQMDVINKKIPSKDDPYYRYLLEEVHGGITHREYHDIMVTKNVRANDAECAIERAGHDYKRIAKWMSDNGYHREVPKCERKYEKLQAGGNLMRRGTMVPKDYIGAFVGHYPKMLTHPYEDRYITIREAMTIMGLPQDFELLDPKNSINHICQNVPYETAKDMATEIKHVFEGNRPWSDTDFLFQTNIDETTEQWNVTENNLESFFG